ncbi:hypothetical protein [Dactylosporangium sp. CA-233914]|uniref:hypothetical protein n=1 Tax=Dactylosporangium sp. CA-233914 TaxID=3239934 RepID=UPI003D9368F7
MSRGLLLRPRSAPVRPDGRLVAYGSVVVPNPNRMVRIVLGADLLADELLADYLKSMPARVRARVLVDAGAVEPRLSALDALAAATKLGVRVELPWDGDAPEDVDWDRLELLDADGVPAGLPYARTAHALPPGVQARQPAPGRSGPRLWPEANYVLAGVHLPPGDASGLQTADSLHLAELHPMIADMLVVFVYGEGAAIVWEHELYDADKFSAAIPGIAQALGVPLHGRRLMVVNLARDVAQLDAAFGRQVSESLGTAVVLVDGPAPIPLSEINAGPERFTTADGSPARLFTPGHTVAQPLAPALHDTLRLLHTTARPGEPAGPPRQYTPEELLLLATPTLERLHWQAIPGLRQALRIQPRDPLAKKLLRWIEVIGRVPDDLPALATEFGVRPRDLFDLARRLAVDPRLLRPFAELLPAAFADGPVAAWSRLREALHDAGAHSGTDLVLLLELADRHSLGAADLPVLRSLARRGLPVELLHYLPAELTNRILARERQRITEPASAQALVEQWELRDEPALRKLARRLRVSVEDLPGLYGRQLDAAVQQLWAKRPDVTSLHARYASTVNGWVTNLATEVEKALRAEWGVAANGLPWAMEASGRLGFPVTELAGIPSTRHRDLLLAQTLMDGIPRDTMRLLAMMAPPGEPALPAYPGRDLSEVDRLGRRLGLSPQDLARLARLTDTIGRVPADLAALAYRMDIPARLLLEVAAALDTDPRHLLPFGRLLYRADRGTQQKGIGVDQIVRRLRELAVEALGPASPTVTDPWQQVPIFFWLATAAQLGADRELTFLDRLSTFSQRLRTELRGKPLDEILSQTGWAGNDWPGITPPDPGKVLFGGTAPYRMLLVQYWAERLQAHIAQVATFAGKHRHADLDALVAMAADYKIGGLALLAYATAIGRVPIDLRAFTGNSKVAVNDIVWAGATLKVDPLLTLPVVLRDSRGDLSPLFNRASMLETVLVPQFGVDPATILSIMADFGRDFDPDRLPRPADLTEWRAIAWGMPPDAAAGYGTRLDRVQHTALARLVSELVARLYPDQSLPDQSPSLRLISQVRMSRMLLETYILRIGRVPTDLGTVAASLGVASPARLLALAARLNVDIRVLRDSDGVQRLNRDQPGGHLLSGVEKLAREIEASGDWPERDRPERNVLEDLLWLTTHTARVPADLVVLADSANGELPVTLLLATARDLGVDPRSVAALVRDRAAGVVNATATSLDGTTRGVPLRQAILDRYRDWAAGLYRGHGLPEPDIWSFFTWLAGDRTLASSYPGDATALVTRWFDQQLARLSLGNAELKRMRAASRELRANAGRAGLSSVDYVRVVHTLGFIPDPIVVADTAAALNLPPRRLLALAEAATFTPAEIGVLTTPADRDSPLAEAAKALHRNAYDAAASLGAPTPLGAPSALVQVVLTDLGVPLADAGSGDDLGRLMLSWTSLVLGIDVPAPGDADLLRVALRLLYELRFGLDRTGPRKAADSLGLSPVVVMALSLHTDKKFTLRNRHRWGAEENRRLVLLGAHLGMDPAGLADAEVRKILNAPGTTRAQAVRTAAEHIRTERGPAVAAPSRLAAKLRSVLVLARQLALTGTESVRFQNWMEDNELQLSEADGPDLPQLRAWRVQRFPTTLGGAPGDLTSFPWLQPALICELSGELGRGAELIWELSRVWGRVPDDIVGLAARVGVPPAELFDLAGAVGVDPALVVPLLSHEWPTDRAGLGAAMRAWLDGMAERARTDDATLLGAMLDSGWTVADLDNPITDQRDRLAQWAQRLLGADQSELDELATKGGTGWRTILSWLVHARQWHAQLFPAARRLGVTDHRLAVLSLRVGRALSDVPELASRAGVDDPLRLLELGQVLGVDPKVLVEQEWIRRLNTSTAEEVADWFRQEPDHQRRLPSAPAVAPLITATARLVRKHALATHEVVSVLRRLAEAGLDALSVTDAGFAAMVTAERAGYWADHFGVPVDEIAEDLAKRPWLSHVDLVSAANAANVAHRDLLILARRVGRQPTSVLHAAKKWGVPAARLFEVVTAIGIDPIYLRPLMEGLHGTSEARAALIRQRRAALDTWSAETGYDAATLVLAMSDSSVPIRKVTGAEHARTIVEAWLAVTAGLDGPAYQQLAQTPGFDLDQIRAVVEHFAGLQPSRAIDTFAALFGISQLYANGATVRLGPVLEIPKSWESSALTDLLSRTPPAAEPGPYQRMVKLLSLIDPGLSGADAVELHDQSVAGGYPLDTLTPEVSAAYQAYWKARRDRRGGWSKPVAELLLRRLGHPWQLPGGRSATVVHGGSGAPGPDASGEQRLYEHLLGVPADWPATDQGSAGTLARELDRLRAGEPAAVDAEEPPAAGDAPEPARRAGDKYGWWGRFLSADGSRAHGLDGVVEHIAGTVRGRGIVMLRSPGGTAGSGVRVLNVFGGDAGEVVFLDPLTGSPADLSGTAPLDVLFQATEGGVTAPFEPADPSAGAVPDRPAPDVSGLGLHPVEVGPFIAGLTGPAPTGPDAVAAVRHWRFGRWSRLFQLRPEIIAKELEERPWLGYSEMVALARATGAPPAHVRQLSMTIGRVPADLPDLARRIGSTPGQLWEWASTLRADPWQVASMLGEGADGPAVTRLDDRLTRVSRRVGDTVATLLAVLTDAGVTAGDLDDLGDDILVERYHAWLRDVLDVAPEQSSELLHAPYPVHSLLHWAALAVAGSADDLARAAQAAGTSWQQEAVRRLRAHPMIHRDLGTTPDTGTDTMDIDSAGTVGRFLVRLAEFVQRHALRPHEIGPVISGLADTAQNADEAVRKVRTTHQAHLLQVEADEVDADRTDRPWLDHDRLRNLLPSDKQQPERIRRIWSLARSLGRMPDELPDLAAKWKVGADVIAEIAVRIAVEPGWLSPMLVSPPAGGSLTELVQQWSEKLYHFSSALGRDRALVLQAIGASGLDINSLGDLDALRSIVDRWVAEVLGISRPVLHELEQEPAFDLTRTWPKLRAIVQPDSGGFSRDALAARLGADWTVPTGEVHRVVHAASGEPEPAGSGARRLYLYQLGLHEAAHPVTDPQQAAHRLHRAFAVDRRLAAVNPAAALAPTPAEIELDELLRRYPGSRGPVDLPADSGLHDVIRYVAGSPGRHGLVFHRTAGAGGVQTEGVLNVVRAPGGEVVFIDPVTLLPGHLPTSGATGLRFLPTGTAPFRPSAGPAGPDPRPLVLPQGVTELAGVLVAGASPGVRPLWSIVGERAAGLGRPVIVESPEDPATLVALGQLLERLRWNAEGPIVVLGSTAPPGPDLLELLARHGVALVHQAPPAAANGAAPQLTNVWAVTGPDGASVRYDGAELTAAVFQEAAARSPRSPGGPPPAALVDWLTADPQRSGAMLIEQLTELTDAEVRRWLQEMTDRAAAGDGTGPAHIALLDLAVLGHADRGLAYRAAPNPQRRAAAAFGTDPAQLAQLRTVADPLARLASATAADRIDRANAAVLAAIDIVLNAEEPDPGKFDRSAIFCLPGEDRLEWVERLEQLTPTLGDDLDRVEVLGKLILLVLTCKPGPATKAPPDKF